MPKTPLLLPINLKKCFSKESDGGFHSHPDIKLGRQYLAKINGRYFAGKFTDEWYGLSFDGWYNSLQLDKPGTNASDWQGLWEISNAQR